MKPTLFKFEQKKTMPREPGFHNWMCSQPEKPKQKIAMSAAQRMRKYRAAMSSTRRRAEYAVRVAKRGGCVTLNGGSVALGCRRKCGGLQGVVVALLRGWVVLRCGRKFIATAHKPAES